MTITEQPPTATMEYNQRSDLTAANELAAEGWQLHSVVASGSNVWFVMQRQRTAPDLAMALETETYRAERDRLAEQLANALDNGEALIAQRNELAERVQRLQKIVLQGGQDAATVRRELLAEMTPGELLQVRRADPAGGPLSEGSGG